MAIKLLDCTLRDGGYYNNWDFPLVLINDYLHAMNAISADYVELGFRSLVREGFKGACAYSTDSFIRTLSIPQKLKVCVMVNASELVNHSEGINSALAKLFTSQDKSPVSLVRIACHIHEFEKVLPASIWLKAQGYEVGYNLMQVADRSEDEITAIAVIATKYPLDVLYFADSMGSLTPDATNRLIKAFRMAWKGELGIHTHDNINQALANSVLAVNEGVNWVDCTVTGMGRGPGNVKTENLVLELISQLSRSCNISSLLKTIRIHFQPLLLRYKWGSNPYYFLSGKYAIHPSFIQEMLADNRYNEEDILTVIEHLKSEGGKKFNYNKLEAARNFFIGEPRGLWNPTEIIKGREVLILGPGSSVEEHRVALEIYIANKKPFVMALNTKKSISEELINIRVACHPVRLLSDSNDYSHLPQPLATPASMLPQNILDELKHKQLLDFGLSIREHTFEFHNTYAIIPSSLVVAYALAIATSGGATNIMLAGFDGYDADDPRRQESNDIFHFYKKASGSIPLLAITPTRYELACSSVYALVD